MLLEPKRCETCQNGLPRGAPVRRGVKALLYVYQKQRNMIDVHGVSRTRGQRVFSPDKLGLHHSAQISFAYKCLTGAIHDLLTVRNDPHLKSNGGNSRRLSE